MIKPKKVLSSFIPIILLVLVPLPFSELTINVDYHSTTINSFSELSHKNQYIIDGNEEFIAEAAAEGWTGNGSLSNPFIIKDLIFQNEGIDSYKPGIYINNVDLYFIIENCSNLRIELTNVIHGNISQNISLEYVNLTNTSNIGINDNYFNSSFQSFGIELSNSSFNMITNNKIRDKAHPIFLEYASNNNTIANNLIEHCGWVAFSYGDGIIIYGSSYNVIINNTIKNSYSCGISLSSSNYTSIIWNTLVENNLYGIELSRGSSNNSIHHNNFFDSFGYVLIQAYDEGIQNNWYDETVMEGNYWADYNGTGYYLIAGPIGAIDPYPLRTPCIYKSDLETAIINFSLLIRIGLFLFIVGILVVPLLIRRNRLSF